MALALALGQWLREGVPLPRGLVLGLPEMVGKAVGGALEEALPLREVRGLLALTHPLAPTLAVTVALLYVVGVMELVVVALVQPWLLTLALEEGERAGEPEAAAEAEPLGVLVRNSVAVALLVEEVLTVLKALAPELSED